MPEIRIAALDLDGTLLSRENTVTPATRQAIADAVGRGVIVLPWGPTRWARSTAAIPTRKRARPASPPALSGGSSRWKRPGRCSGCIRNSRVP